MNVPFEVVAGEAGLELADTDIEAFRRITGREPSLRLAYEAAVNVYRPPTSVYPPSTDME